MKKRNIFLTAFAGLTMFFQTSAFAANHATESSTLTQPHPVTVDSEYKPHVGVLFGVASPEGSYDAGAQYGVDVGFQPYIPFGLALEIEHSNAESRTSADNFDRTTVLAKGTYNFAGDASLLKYSYVGLGLGRSFASSGDLLMATPLVGFDVPLTALSSRMEKPLSIGAVAKYALYEGSNPDVLTLSGMVKYWF